MERYVDVRFPGGELSVCRRRSAGDWMICHYVDEFEPANRPHLRAVNYGPATFGHVDLFLDGEALRLAELDGGDVYAARRTVDLSGSEVGGVSTSERQYLTVTDTAKLLRAHLRREFPGVKFSVRSDKYAGGASIDVSWTDGPTDAAVEAVTSSYAGGRFDGMIDMASYVSHWLEEDGTVTLAHDGGTEGQRGSRSEVFGSRRTPGAVLVHLGADYVFTSRAISEGFACSCETVVEPNGTFGSSGASRCDGCGSWPAGSAVCFVAHTVDRFGSERVVFVCSSSCGGRLVARGMAAAAR